MSFDLDLPERPRILVITLRRLGDVLLSTSLTRTLRASWPKAAIEALVFSGTEGILAGNPDLAGVQTISPRPSAGELARLAGRMWRRYDLAFSTQTGDRPMALLWAAGRTRVGFVAEDRAGAWWKRRVLHRRVPVDADNHRVPELLRLAECLGLSPDRRVVCPQNLSARSLGLTDPYAVVHANPMFRYRRWTDEGWRGVVRSLKERGHIVVATGGPEAAEQAYLDALWGPLGPLVRRLDGRLSWPELTALLRGAAVYVGPDTSMTHLAAASGCPTVALYGPASPRRIGPWPVDGLSEPWAHAGTIQRRSNVWVVQNPLDCLPCERVGCEGHVGSYSRCLDELPVRQVLAAVDAALASRRPEGPHPVPRQPSGHAGSDARSAAS